MSLKAAYKADIILYMVDGKGIPEDEDKKLFYELQSLGKEVCLVVNKIDNDKMKDEKLWDFYEFGCDAIFGISVSHNRGTVDLLDWVYNQIPDSDIIKENEEDDIIISEPKFDDAIDDEEFFTQYQDEEDDGYFHQDMFLDEEAVIDDSIFVKKILTI